MSAEKIYKLDPNTLPTKGTMVFIGGTESGKSTLMFDIVYHFRHYFQSAIVFCGSTETALEWSTHIPGSFVFDNFDENKLDSILDDQELAVIRGTAGPMLVVVDDMSWNKKNILNAPIMRRLMMNGRHSKVLALISMQYCKDIGPDIRTQIKAVFLCREGNPVNRQRIFEAWNNVFTNFAEFDTVFRACTVDYNVLALVKNMKSDKVSDCCFWYKAQNRGNYRVNKHGYWWRFHSRRFDTQHLEKAILRKKMLSGMTPQARKKQLATKTVFKLPEKASVRREKKAFW